MHHRDVTEILKLFEKRITKLEKRVGDLEAELEDIKEKEPKKQEQSAAGTLAPPFDNISIKTVAYNDAVVEKVKYTKSDILELKQFDELASCDIVGYPKLPPPIDPELLEEGEVFEPWLRSSSMSSISPKSTGTNKEQLGSEGTPSSAKPGRSRQGKSQQQQQQRKKLGDRPEFRERAKSESAAENITITTKSEDNAIANLSAKKEMRYGLMVQFPPEEGEK